MTGLKDTLKAIFAVAFIALFTVASAQDQGFIYGRITTEDGDEYTGPIRWGKEEVYWSDMFNASKKDNKNLDYLSNRELDRLRDTRRSDNFVSRFVSVSWDSDDYEFVHEFSTAFGNIKSMRIRSSDRVEVELKNGKFLRLDGSGYNDVGAKIRVLDYEIGKIAINWRDIETIEFMPTPSNLDEKYGEPLYGTVESDLGEFTGYIQWDHDERVGSDKLDGDTYDGDVSISFDKIKSIERDGYSRSIVELKSGRELELRGSNDVNDDNRGIIVNVKGLGRVDIEWEDFDKVTFKDAPSSGTDYNSYGTPNKLTGTVVVDNGDQHSGEITYDLDEEYDIEVLNGEDGKTKFIIPFKYIKEVTPKSYDESSITLKSGDKILLEDSQDVGERHSGILIKTQNDRVYVPWDRVEKVTFD